MAAEVTGLQCAHGEPPCRTGQRIAAARAARLATAGRLRGGARSGERRRRSGGAVHLAAADRGRQRHRGPVPRRRPDHRQPHCVGVDRGARRVRVPKPVRRPGRGSRAERGRGLVLPSVSETAMTDGSPLDGIVVVDLSRALAGPHAAMMLGDLGARVIKVEAPGKGDDTRNWGPPFVTPAEGDRESTYFLSCNRNKESITLDLKSEDGARTLGRLVRHADVLVENFRTGVLDRLGYGMPRLTELNPRLVVLSITGFGHDGPEGGRAGYDQIAQGEAGIMSVTGPLGGEPTRVGVPIGDLLAGMYGAYGVVAALHDRERTGHGQIVRTSLLAALVGVHAFQGTMYTVGGVVPQTTGAHHPSICPYGLFHCADGVVQIAVGSESLWRAFAPAFGLDRPQWAANPQRVTDAP